MQTVSFQQSQALDDLKRAVDFFDKVEASSQDEKVAVGADHYEWLIKAARAVRNKF